MTAVTGTIDLLTMPVIVCAGDARTRGRVHGEALRGEIARGLERWFAGLGEAHGVDPDDYLAEFLERTNHVPAIERWMPDALDEVRGIAEGAGQAFARIISLNLMDEEWSYGQARRRGTAPGCTAACFLTARGTPVIAQTMDLPSCHDGTQAVLRIVPENGPEIMTFTMAGFINLMGVNASGVGVVVNNLDMLPRSTDGLPVAFIVRGILGQTTLAGAAGFVQRVPHAIGQHYGIGGPEGLASFEGAANGVMRDAAADTRIIHANHPLVNLAVDGDAERRYARSSTFARSEAVAARAGELTDLAGVEVVLSETTAPVSRVPMNGFMTFGAMSAELSAPPRVRFAAGPPHLTPYRDVPFSAA